jgi:hypothetical protein
LAIATIVPQLPISSSRDSYLHCYGRKFREEQLTAMHPSSIASASLTADRSISHFCAAAPGAVYKACDA